MDLMKLADAISDGFEIWCLVLKLTLQMLFFLKFDRLLPSEVSDSSNELRKQVLSPGLMIEAVVGKPTWVQQTSTP